MAGSSDHQELSAQVEDMTTQTDVTADREVGRADRDARRMAAWKRRMDPVVMVAAILPIVVALTERGQSGPAVWLDLGSWAVFIVDYLVRVRLRPDYWRSRLGVFDLVIVVLTAPWYLVPAFDGARILGLARLGRLVRMFMASTKGSVLRDLGRRLGSAAMYSLVLMACAALVIRATEPAESGFDSYGDALWWSMVTFTTVGYGDLFPVTAAGRLAAVMLMLGGVALIGALAGSLGSFFKQVDDADGADAATLDRTADDSTLLDEVRSMRAELEELRRVVTGSISPAPADPGPAQPDDRG
jgi:voltage-gated potassium channel